MRPLPLRRDLSALVPSSIPVPPNRNALGMDEESIGTSQGVNPPFPTMAMTRRSCALFLGLLRGRRLLRGICTRAQTGLLLPQWPCIKGLSTRPADRCAVGIVAEAVALALTSLP